LLVLATYVSIKTIKIQMGVIRDCHKGVLIDSPIPIQERLPRRPQMADRTTQSNRQHQPDPRQFFTFIHAQISKAII
jgi:hypothetical protein